MWVIQLNIVDWVYFKTQIFMETLKIQNQDQTESCVSLEVEHLFPQVGCARSKRQCLTVPQNRKLLRWTRVCEWMVSLLIHRMTGNHQPREKQETVCVISTPGSKGKVTRMLISCQIWITWPQMQVLLNVKHSCIFLKTTKQWSRWSSKADVQWWDTCPEPTEFLLIGCLTESIWTPRFKWNMLTPRTNLQTCWPKVAPRVMNGVIFFVCSSSWISRSFLAAIFFQLKREPPFRREFRKGRREKSLR